MLMIFPPVQAAAPDAARDARAVLDQARSRVQVAQEALKLHMGFGKPRSSFDPKLKPVMDSFDERLKTEQRPQVRQALLVAKLYLMPRIGIKATPEFRQEVLKEVPPTSIVWSLEPNLLLYSASAMKDEKAADAYIAEARDKHADPKVRGPLVYNRFEEGFYGKQEIVWKPALAQLDRDFSGEAFTKNAHTTVEYAAKTALGIAAPAFSVASLDHPKITFTNDTFKGKYLLIDFWATWCGPCRSEMPKLHEAYGKFKDKGLQVLSLSFDHQVEDIAPYRNDPAHSMPWNHAFVEGGFRSPLALAFGVRGIPKPVLVGPDGKILATENDLRGAELEKTLEKFLGKP